MDECFWRVLMIRTGGWSNPAWRMISSRSHRSIPNQGAKSTSRRFWWYSRPRMMFVRYGNYAPRCERPERPLLACVGRYEFPTIRPLLGTDLQGLIMAPFDGREFRAKVDQMELGF